MLPLKMQHQEFAPPLQLQDTIKCFWHNIRSHAGENQSFEVVPDGYAEIIFHFGDGCSVALNGGLQHLPSPFMMGLLNQPVTFYPKNHFEIIAVRCFPWTVFDLLNLTPGKGSVRFFQHPVAGLQPKLNRLVADNKIAEAVNLLSQYFLDLRLGISSAGLLQKAGNAMRQSHGTLAVSEVADAAHSTVRTLERNFKRSSGHTVKDVSALIRFEQVRNQLWHFPSTNLTALAHPLGYTDQPHLSREFKRYSGTTPAAFARKAKGNQQFAGSDFVAFVQV